MKLVNNENRTVLLVEDDNGVRESVKQYVGFLGYQCVEARDGEEAMLHIESGLRPFVMLLDLNMPILSGWDLLEMLEKRGVEIPTVIMTASRRIPQGYWVLEKPFNIEDIDRALSEFYGRWNQEKKGCLEQLTPCAVPS